MSRSMLNFGKRVEIYNFLKEKGTIENGFFQYGNGLSDVVVAQKFGISPGNVQSVRMELAPMKKAPFTKIVARLDKLEADLLHLQAWSKGRGYIR